MLDTAGLDPTDFDPRNQHSADEKLLVKFFHSPRLDKAATAEAGRNIFKDVEHISIHSPGKKDGVARPATPRDKERFPRHYQAFKNRMEMPEEGTLLSEVSFLTRRQVEELAFFNVKTVEQLISVSDTNAQKFMGINALKETAKKWLEHSEKVSEVDKLAAQLNERDEKILALEAKMEELMAQSHKPASRKKKQEVED